MKTIRRLFLLCVCAALLCSAAFAETGIIDLGNCEYSENFLKYCRLPDGRLVFAGFQGTMKDNMGDKARLLCLNPDGSVSWEYLDDKADGFLDVTVTKENTLAALYDRGVKFFSLDGTPTGKKLSLLPADGFYDVTPGGVMVCHREGSAVATYLEMLDWDGNVLFRVDEPESMWVGSEPIEEEDGLVLFGQAAGDAVEAPAKVTKIDYQGNKVWETILPFLSEKRWNTGISGETKTEDGGYLGILWDYVEVPGTEDSETHRALVKLDAKGHVLWTKDQGDDLWLAAEYDGKYVAQSHDYDPATDVSSFLYQWFDTEGNELGKTNYAIREEDLPRFVDRKNWSATVEDLIPTENGLWQRFTFWEVDDPEDEAAASFCQDTGLAPVPVL